MGLAAVGGGASRRPICPGGMPLLGVRVAGAALEVEVALGVDGGGMLCGADALGARAWAKDGVWDPEGVLCFDL